MYTFMQIYIICPLTPYSYIIQIITTPHIKQRNQKFPKQSTKFENKKQVLIFPYFDQFSKIFVQLEEKETSFHSFKLSNNLLELRKLIISIS